MKCILTVFLAGVLFVTISAQNQSEIKMSDFIGINTNVAAYDQKYIGDLAECVKWIREYHSWAHYEVADNYYRWDNITKTPYTYTWPDHNKFMDECKKLGLNVLIDVLNKPGWAGTARGAYSTGDGRLAADYLDKLEFMGQLVARYGAQKIDNSKLETADKVSGLNYIKYYEDDNEPDYWWESPLWPAEKYAVYCNAVHDGFGVQPNVDYPLLGIKSVDSTAMHVLGGLAEKNTTYIQKILAASNGRIPFDVINIHTYCSDHKDGYSPENEKYGLEKNLGGFVSWCKSVLPEIPVWITEFGWDTFLSSGAHSYIYAPHQQQANYIIRSYFICLKMGFGKAFLFMDKDPNSTNILQYSTSGIITDQGTGLSKKISYYYLATLQKTVGDAVLKDIPSYGELIGNNQVYCFEFTNNSSEKIYALWTREKNSSTDTGTTLNYTLNIGYQPEYAAAIHLKDKDMDGERTELEVNGTSIEVLLTETPQFIVVSENKTSLNESEKKDFDFKVFPNPASKSVRLFIQNPEFQKINVSAFSLDGKLIEIIADRYFESGRQQLKFGENINPGLYFVCLSAKNAKQVVKVVVQ